MQKLENFFFRHHYQNFNNKSKKKKAAKRIDRKGIHKQGESEEVPKGKKQRDQTQFK